MNELTDPNSDTLALRMATTRWDVVATLHSRSGVELRLWPTLLQENASPPDPRIAYGRDAHDALRRFAWHLIAEQAVEGG